MSDIGYSEKDFENYIVSLLTAKSGYIHGSNNDYNPQKSILPQTFIFFVKSAQPDNWTCLCDKFDTEQEAEEKLIDELTASRKSQGYSEAETQYKLRSLAEPLFKFKTGPLVPFAPDAWIDEKKNVVGYEIPFTRYFYKYEAPKPSSQIMDEIKELEKNLAGSLTEIFGE